ncbi:MAG: AMP-binding protein [Planctomycetes bacterium]|nr:AMP-binding protein [Planctomycetota bacterium]
MSQASPDLLTLVRSAGARPATRLSIGDESCDGGEFARRVESLGAAMRAAGLRDGERIAVLLHRSVDEAAVLLATAAAGGVAVPIHGKLKDDQIRHVLQDCDPFLVVTSATRLLALRDAAATLAGRRVWRSGAEPVPVVSESLPASDGTLPPTPPPPDSAAALLYTSGSTGLQKGIVQDHRNLALGAAIVADYLGLGAGDHVLGLLPFSFDYGLNQLLSALHVGCRITAADHLGAGELATLLRRVRPTGLAGVPSLWHEVAAGLQSGVLTPDDGTCLRYVTNSGGALRTADSAVMRRHWPSVRVFAMYGLTEAFRSAFLPPEEFDRFAESFGRALPGVELLLVSPETGRVLEGPATGELVHAGALVARGYWRRPEETARRFRPDPRGTGGTVVFSGDIVRRDEGGRHWFVGRSDRLLKVNGHRVSPDEVAAAVAGTEDVGEVAVFGVDGGAAGHAIVLVVSGDEHDPELRERVVRLCRTRLPSYMSPTIVRVVAAMPHNQNGKVDEGALRAMLGQCTDVT